MSTPASFQSVQQAAIFLQDARLVVFDLDGTLYRQRPVRLAMLQEVLTASVPQTSTAPGRLERLRILRKYRQMRENEAGTRSAQFDMALYQRLAAWSGRSETDLRVFIHDWMECRPLRHLLPSVMPGAAELFALLRHRGVNVAVWSDYPVTEKLTALNLTVDCAVSAIDEGVDALKPDPSGLSKLMKIAACPPERTLMIGDRMSRDAVPAAALKVPFILAGGKTIGRDVLSIRNFLSLVNAMKAL